VAIEPQGGRIAGWTNRPLASITDNDAMAMLNAIAAQGKKSMANHTKSLCRWFFGWAKEPGHEWRLTVNPFADLGRAPGGPRTQRERHLSPQEIRQLWRALDQPEQFDITPDTATALRLVLATGCRPGMSCATSRAWVSTGRTGRCPPRA
jgi:integrase